MTNLSSLLAFPFTSPLTQAEAAQLIRLRDALREQQGEIENLAARLHGAESANRAMGAEIVEHVELNGHVDVVEQLHDYLLNESTSDPTGKLQDFCESLRIVIDQLDRQRRQRNWYEVAHTAGKQKLIESALEKQVSAHLQEIQRLDLALAKERAHSAETDRILRNLLQCYDDGEIATNCPPTLGRDNNIIECPGDDTCSCAAPRVINDAAKVVDWRNRCGSDTAKPVDSCEEHRNG
jgi:predicted GTPase